jgi:predicted dehydrogenase
MVQENHVLCVSTRHAVWEQEPAVAFITAPSNWHTELALEAARQNCHLFIEKPLAHTTEGIDTLCAEVAQRELCTMVGCNMRFHPGPATVKRLMEEGQIGPVVAARIQSGSYLPSWRPWQDYRQSYSASPVWGGAVLDCIHEIDLALWYFGAARVVGSALLPATSIGLETDGLAEILLAHTNGVLSNVHLNILQRDYRRTCQVIGREGTISWDFAEGVVSLYGSDGNLDETVAQPEGWEFNQVYIDEVVHFFQAIQHHTPTMNPLEGGLAALEIALSVRQQKPVSQQGKRGES